MTNRAHLAALLAELVDALADANSAPAPEPPRTPSSRVLLTVEEAAQQLGIGKTLMWRLVGNHEIESVRIGRLRRVPRSAIDDYAARLVAQQNNEYAA